MIYEEVDFGTSEKAQGVDWAICSIHQTMFRPGKDDYDAALEQLVKGLEQGLGKQEGKGRKGEEIH